MKLLDDMNFRTRPTKLLDSVKLNVEENPRLNNSNFDQSKADTYLSHIVNERDGGNIDVYFDAVIQSPVDMINDCELCFCLQRDG